MPDITAVPVDDIKKMVINVRVPPALRELSNGKADVPIGVREDGTILDVIKGLKNTHPKLRRRLLKRNQLVVGIRVYLDGIAVDATTRQGLRVRIAGHTEVEFIISAGGGFGFQY